MYNFDAPSVSGLLIQKSAEHFDKGADAGFELFGILVGIVGFDAEAGHTGFFHRTFHKVSFSVVQVAELEVDIDNPIRFKFGSEPLNIFDSLFIRGKACTVDVSEVAFS